jgi:hypothetical protein
MWLLVFLNNPQLQIGLLGVNVVSGELDFYGSTQIIRSPGPKEQNWSLILAPMQEGVLRGAGSDPSFLFQLLTLQKGLRLSDWDIALQERPLGYPSVSVPQGTGNPEEGGSLQVHSLHQD